MTTAIQKRPLFDLPIGDFMFLAEKVLLDAGYSDDDGNLTPLGEDYLATIKEEATETFDVPLQTVNNLSDWEADDDVC